MQINPKTVAERYAAGWREHAGRYRDEARRFGLDQSQRNILEGLATAAEAASRRWKWEARRRQAEAA